MLLGSNLLEVAIGVVFVYLLFSVLCSALSELIESFLRFRASDLKKGVGKLLNDRALARQLLNHPLIRPLGEKPSYIPARTFSLALWSIATEAMSVNQATGGVTQDLSAIRKSIASLNDEKYGSIKTPLLTLIDQAGNDINKARANIEEWYNDAMDRVSGWYKRRTHWILIVIGLVGAALLNIDTINVVRALWYNDTMRNSIVTAAETYIKNPAQQTQSGEAAANKNEDPEAQARAALDKVNHVRGEINKLGLPIGWARSPNQNDTQYKDASGNLNPAYYQAVSVYNTDPRRLPDGSYSWFLKILGIIFTALAVSQGAPFWFDVLNKFMVIRSTVKPREKSQEESSKEPTVREPPKVKP